MKNPLKKSLSALAAIAALTPSAFAASAAWDGDTSAFWNNSANWSAAFPNANADIATFNINSPNNTISLGQSILVRQILFDTANAGAYTIDGSATELTFATSSALGITINSTVGAVTQTINARANIQLSTSFTNNSASASLNLAGGVNNNLGTDVTAQFTGAGNGGTINGLTQTGGGAMAVTLSNTGGVWEIAGTHTASGLLTVSGVGGITRLSSDLSSTAGTTLSGHLQINNASASGGLNAAAGIAQSGILEAFGADRTINTTTHTLFASTFVGTQSLTIGSLATMSGASGAITNNISGVGEKLTFNNAGNFSLSDSATNRIRTITGSGHTVISSNIVNGGGSAASGITKTGSGTLELSGNNSYTGLTTVSGGVLLLGSANALGAGGGTTNLLINTGGVVGLGNGDFTRGLGSGVTQVRFSGGGGGFAAYGADRNVNIGGASATLAWAQTSFVPTGGVLVLGASDSTHKLTFQNGLNLANDARTVQVNNGSAAIDGEFSGGISSTTAASGSLTKTGDGTLNLSANTTYTGLTTVSAGTLLVNASMAGGADVAAGAALGGAGTIAGATTISGSLRPGNSIGTLTVQNDVTWNAGDAWVFELGTSAASLALANSGGSTQDQLNITGVGSDFLSGTGTVFTFDFAGSGAAGWYKVVDYSGTTDFVASDFVATNLTSGLIGTFTVDAATSAVYLNVVPEPGTVGLFTAGLMATLFIRRRRLS